MKRCMIVDDSSVIRKVAKRILGGEELLVIEAASGYDALSMCSEEMPHVIVLDAGLPDITAVEFIQRACGLAGAVKPHILLCITEFDIGAIMRAKRAGAVGYLFKPFTRPQLLEHFRALPTAA